MVLLPQPERPQTPSESADSVEIKARVISPVGNSISKNLVFICVISVLLSRNRVLQSARAVD